MADTQLKPFQIRNLHVYPAEENLYDSSTESIVSNSPEDETQTRPSSLIHLSAREYDSIISDHPNGTLTYIDDDDGDIITVGSSFELEQRLDEPTQYTAITSPNQTEPAPIHLFDIRRRRSVIRLWKDIEKRSELHWDFKVPEQTTTKFMDSSIPSEAGTSFQSRRLDANESTDLRKRWLDACRPPRLQSHETEKEVPSPNPKDLESSSPTIMSLSAITDEGRRQAKEAGSRIRSIWNAPTGVSQAAPDFIRNQQNPWAVSAEPVSESKDNCCAFDSSTEKHTQASESHQSPPVESRPSQSEAGSQPLLFAFEAEMAKILENAQDSVNEADSFPTPEEPQTHRPESVEQTWPVSLMTGILQTVAGGIENLGSELKTKIPEMERHLANAQRAIPEDFGTKIETAMTAVESQIQNLAQIIQRASDASGEAAERVRQADVRSTEEVLNGLGDMAHEFEDFGKTLFAAFEAEFSQRTNCDGANVTDPATAEGNTNPAQSHTQEEKDLVDTQPLNQNAGGPALEVPADATVTAAPATVFQQSPPARPAPLPSHLRESSLSEIRSSAVQHDQPQVVSPLQQQQGTEKLPPSPRDLLLSEIRSRPSLRDFSPSEIRSRAIQTNRPQVTSPLQEQETEKPLFANWPNRPAFVLPPKPAVAQPPSVPTVTRPPVPPKTVNDKPTEPPRALNTDAALSETRGTERSEDTSKSLFMGNIRFEVTERVIEEVFASQSFSAKVHLPIDSSTGKHAGFGYAHFPSTSSAKDALSRLQGVVIDGHSLNLEYCDNSPIDVLQTQAPVSQPVLSNSYPSSAEGVGERRPPVSSGDNLPSVFSGNARSIMSLANGPRFSHDSSLTSQDHPEETPEFAARYPSLLPTFKSQDHSLTAPARSLTLSPNSEMARFPPVSQIDAHLLADNQRFSRDLADTNRGRSAPHGVSRLPREETGTATAGEEHGRMREPRRVSSTINRRSSARLATKPDSVHALRRRATEANSLRHRAYGNPFREQRPASLYERPTGSIPGSFPVDDTPAPASNNDELNTIDTGFQYAMRQSLIDQCVDQLLNLGYGTYVDGGRDRLRIIAEAANLQVSDAIDMIEEERTAYERYTPNA